jgi:predicted RNase H-like HicB family nuclease
MTYTVIYEKGPTSWGAYVPDLPGVISVGDSRDGVERLIREAIEFHIEGMREEGIAIPSPSSLPGWSKSIPPLETRARVLVVWALFAGVLPSRP